MEHNYPRSSAAGHEAVSALLSKIINTLHIQNDYINSSLYSYMFRLLAFPPLLINNPAASSGVSINVTPAKAGVCSCRFPLSRE